MGLILACGMDDLRPVKFCEAGKLSGWSKIPPVVLRAREFRPVWSTYVHNITRARSLVVVPGYAYLLGSDWQLSLAEARRRKSAPNESTPEILKYATKLLLHNMVNQDRKERADNLEGAMGDSEYLMSKVRITREALEVVLESMIVQSWAAFEVLAEDLYLKAIGNRPSLDKRDAWKMIRARNNQFGFQSRNKIANLYRWTFEPDNSTMLRVLDSPAFHALGIARNVLAHSAGLIDSDFQRHRKGVIVFGSSIPIPIPQFRRVRGRKIGYRIRFTGDFAKELINPVTILAFDLVKAVDKWFIDHP